MSRNNTAGKEPPVEGREKTTGEGFSYYADERLMDNVKDDDMYLSISRDSYRTGCTWFDSSLRMQQERNQSLFNSRHPKGSKYYSEQYRKKSKIFRPKVRTAIRKHEAAAAIAFFSTSDVVHCSPVNPRDQRQQLAAEINMALLNMRLEQDIPWFLTCIGAIQDAEKQGVVVSKTEWVFRTSEITYKEEYDDGFGGTHTQTVIEEQINEDRPSIKLLPLENIKVDPACDWRDPINTSPYVIEMEPVYIHELYERMETGEYRELEHGVLKAAIKQDWDSIRKAREGDERMDRYDSEIGISEYQIVWVHHNIARIRGADYCWDTLGTEIVLSDPKLLRERYLHGLRPYQWGISNLESHNPYPAGKPQLLDGLQSEANDLANLRLDNLKLALNKRYLVRRGSLVDVRSLLRNVSGSVTMTNNPEGDVKVVNTPDVTASSYQEQDRLNLDMDDLTGGFNGSSAMANRKVNETVGGMSLTADGQNEVKELDIRTFSETWVENVMRHLIALEAAYETDVGLIRAIGEQVGLKDEQGQWRPLEVGEVVDLLQENVKVKVNVGFNSTNPAKRIEKVALATKVIFEALPHMVMELDPAEFIKEIMGAVGHADGSRFFPSLGKDGPNPQVQAMMKQVQQLQAVIEGKQVEQQGKLQVEQMRQQGSYQREAMKLQAQMGLAQSKEQREAIVSQWKLQLEQFDRQIKAEQVDIDRQELELQREALANNIQQAEERLRQDARKTTMDISTKAAGAAAPESSGGPMDLPGNDKAGVIARDNYDLIPQNSE